MSLWCCICGSKIVCKSVVTGGITRFGVQQTTRVVPLTWVVVGALSFLFLQCLHMHSPSLKTLSLTDIKLNVPFSLFHPDSKDEGYFEKGAENRSWRRRETGWPTPPCTSPRGEKTSANQAVLRWLTLSAMLVFVSLTLQLQPQLAAAREGALPVVAHLTVSGLQRDLFVADLTGVKTCHRQEESRRREPCAAWGIPLWRAACVSSNKEDRPSILIWFM